MDLAATDPPAASHAAPEGGLRRHKAPAATPSSADLTAQSVNLSGNTAVTRLLLKGHLVSMAAEVVISGASCRLTLLSLRQSAPPTEKPDPALRECRNGSVFSSTSSVS